MGISLNDFKSKVKDGARPNRFLITIDSPFGGTNSEELSYLIKASSIPSFNIGEIELNWQGQKAKISGDPTFDDWSVTFINDYGFKAKSTIEKWLFSIANTTTNDRTEQSEYKADILIEQLGRKGEVLASYKMIGAYPKTMDAIDLSMESNDTLEEFGVTFAYDTFERMN